MCCFAFVIDLFISTVKTNKASDRLFLRGVMIKPPVPNTPADRPRWQRERERDVLCFGNTA